MGYYIEEEESDFSFVEKRPGPFVSNFLKKYGGYKMRIHNLKSDPFFFGLMVAGKYNFSLRVNDRDFKTGDIVRMKETHFSAKEMQNGFPLIYTGESLVFEIGMMFDDNHPAIRPNYCVLIFK